jgi:hypothetical protein
MGFVKGLHNLDAKAVVSAEEHRVVNGASSSAPLFGSHGPPGRQYLGSDWLRVHSAGGGLLRRDMSCGACSDLAKSDDRSCCVRRACIWLEAIALTTPTLASCIGLDRWFADPRTRASLGSQRLKSKVIAGVCEITLGAPTLVTGKRQVDPTGSRNHPIKSWASLREHYGN